ncbi:MAG: TonB-dependent receptor plug domain-containing protein, partial [Verrucomicrobiae bacterium]|nr:TonB-dependent receptor plug domain-containing protein [Verrucomicrobiae bacterium]
MNKKLLWYFCALALPWVPLLPVSLSAQEEDEEEVFELSAFEVAASEDEGYMATTTLAGSRVRSNLRDLGASIAVVTEEFMQDTGATDGQSLLQFVGNVEVGGVLGNFSDVNLDNASTNDTRLNPQNSQRVRGLVSATLTRDYFQTNIPFDGYNTSRVTVNRGPNSILFGLGSPGGVINNSTNRAQIGTEFGEVSVRFDTNNGHRETLDINKTLIENRLAVRVSVLNENIKYRQEPAFEDDQRFYIAWDAVLLENEGSDILGKTVFRGSFEHGDIYSNPPDVVPPTDRFSSWWNGIGDQAYLNQLLQVPGVTLAEIPNGAVTSQQVLAAVNAGYATVPEGMTAEEYAAVEGQFIPMTVIDRFKNGNAASGNGGLNYGTFAFPFFIYPAINYNSVNAQVPGWNDPELAGIQGIMGR